LPYGVSDLNEHLELFQKFDERTLKIFLNNEANFSPVQPCSPNPAYEKVFNSPRRQINYIVNSPNYVPYSPHRINSPIQALSQYDDANIDLENNINFSPIKRFKAENASVFSQSPTAQSMIDFDNKGDCLNVKNFGFMNNSSQIKAEFNGFD